jgi:Domain of unknown function (DUF1996)
MRTLSRALLVCSIVFGALVVLPAPSHAESGAWVVQCRFVKSLPDDPIVHPRMAGMSHLHDFFGNSSTDAASTYQSMRAGGTTCPAGDTAAYWLPSVYRNGVKVDPVGRGVRQQVYYDASNLAPGTHIEPLPPDLRLLAGNARAKGPSENPLLGEELYWGCSDNSVGGKPLAPPASCGTGVISLHVGFPNCWDGTLSHSNDTPHLRYPEGGRCPAGFRHALPRVIVRTEYPVGASTGRITLASGPAFTAHGDFWNTWDQARLRVLVDTCLNATRDCGVFRGSGSAGTTPTSRPRASTTSRPHPAEQSTTTTAPSPSSTEAPTTSAQVFAAASSTTRSTTGGTSLPFTGMGTGLLIVLVIGLLLLGAVTLVRSRVPRRAKQ